jgi:hypothetical protein
MLTAMTKRSKVVLFGNTLLIEGVYASLHTTGDLDIERVESDLPELAEHLQTVCPDVLVFDIVATQTDAMLAALRACPAARLIGLDPHHNTALELSSHVHATLSVNDLTQIIHGG